MTHITIHREYVVRFSWVQFNMLNFFFNYYKKLILETKNKSTLQKVVT